MDKKSLIGAIDQGTSSTRFVIFDESGNQVASAQKEITYIAPQSGWVEEDPIEILNSVLDCVRAALNSGSINPHDVKAIGITNQRETTILWDKSTGLPLHNALVWLDTRNSGICENLISKYGKDAFREVCGLPISTYFSATKIMWLIENVPSVRTAIEKGNCLFGTVDSWLIWKLTGGVHATDVTNASRTMLMDLTTGKWNASLCETLSIPIQILPPIRSSSEIFGRISTILPELQGVPISGVVGDQQAALIGHGCFEKGEAKNTYGTGCFMLFNTGTDKVASTHGLLTTVGYQLGPSEPLIYALEGSIAVAGAAVKWLRDNLNVISQASDMDKLASQVKDTGGVYFVPAFSGLFAPYWRDDARGVIIGLTQYTEKTHIARALLEAVAFQTKEIVVAMEKDSMQKLKKLRVDGGMTASRILLQFQSDILGISVVRPSNSESTVFGAAYAAGLAIGLYQKQIFMEKVFPGREQTGEIFNPQISEEERSKRFSVWKRAVEKSFDWSNVQ
mmetsp:Transcript_136/g.178  ORF Transcript_136/g.178 Transcript_136/m.178 type:complete len:507 (+) Transcript_136:16-1536(+)